MNPVERMKRFARAVLAKRPPEKTYEDPTEPESCPRCGAKVKLIEARDDHELSHEALYACIGLDTREEVEQYLAPSFGGNKVPKGIDRRDPCGWSGLASEWGKTWH